MVSTQDRIRFEIRMGKKKTVVEMLIVFIMVPNALWSPWARPPKWLSIKCLTVPCIIGIVLVCCGSANACAPSPHTCVWLERWGTAVHGGEGVHSEKQNKSSKSGQPDCKLGQLGRDWPTPPIAPQVLVSFKVIMKIFRELGLQNRGYFHETKFLPILQNEWSLPWKAEVFRIPEGKVNIMFSHLKSLF